MNQPTSDKIFIFSDAINSQYIIELYAGDYVMIEETFTDVLTEYDQFVQNINSCYEEKDMAALKSAVHKIKPLFGFVGLTGLQSQCLDFENSCQHADHIILEDKFTSLKANMLHAKSIIESEKGRLSIFNDQ